MGRPFNVERSPLNVGKWEGRRVNYSHYECPKRRLSSLQIV